METSEYRRLMSFWATGVALVTSQGENGPRGCTANSLTSLSLDPPLVLVCFELASRTLEAVRLSRRFALNILAAGQDDLSRLFATKKSQREKFARLDYRLEQDVPVVAGCLAYVVCELEAELAGGDHAIILGRASSGAADEATSPLVFYRSDYLGKSALGRRGGRRPQAARANRV